MWAKVSLGYTLGSRRVGQERYEASILGDNVKFFSKVLT